MLARTAGLTALALTLLPAAARAEQWVYTAHAGGGVTLQAAPSPAPRPSGTVLLESVLGLTDGLNLEAYLLIEPGKTPAVSFGSGVEYVFFNTNHWRLCVGAGAALRGVFGASDSLGVGPYAMAAMRWLFAWGVGASLGIHLLVPIAVAGPEREGNVSVLAVPTLALYQEFW